jgi:uncharacterized membrane protein YwaF
MIVINWDWISFFAGAFAVITIELWIVMYFAFRQWKKARDLQKKMGY